MTPAQRIGRLRSAIASKSRARARARDEARRWAKLAAEMHAKAAAKATWFDESSAPGFAARADAGVARCNARAAKLSAEIDALRAEVCELARESNRCGARCRDGHACRALRVPGAKRCKLHGGKSTGPRTPEGKARALAALAKARLLRGLADAMRAEGDADPGALLDGEARLDGDAP